MYWCGWNFRDHLNKALVFVDKESEAKILTVPKELELVTSLVVIFWFSKIRVKLSFHWIKSNQIIKIFLHYISKVLTLFKTCVGIILIQEVFLFIPK